MGLVYGLDLDKCFQEIHKSNMSKLDMNGRPIYREDGKVMKGPDYRRPNLLNALLGDN
jgi:predicted HAD superfamily Cof-like phosphohydrolase